MRAKHSLEELLDPGRLGDDAEVTSGEVALLLERSPTTVQMWARGGFLRVVRRMPGGGRLFCVGEMRRVRELLARGEGLEPLPNTETTS